MSLTIEDGGAQLLEVEGPKYENKSVVSVVPTRGFVHCLAAQSWCNLQYPINHKHKGPMFICGVEVDAAYNGAIKQIIEQCPEYEYILTMEDDMAIPSMALLRLMQDMGPFDGISALYTRKRPNEKPHVYGDPSKREDFSVLDVKGRSDVVECNAIPMGFTLYRAQLFRDMPFPWFKSHQGIEDGNKVRISQDMWFCREGRRVGKRFAVHCGVHVGHIDAKSSRIYMPWRVVDLHGKDMDGEADA